MFNRTGVLLVPTLSPSPTSFHEGRGGQYVSERVSRDQGGVPWAIPLQLRLRAFNKHLVSEHRNPPFSEG
jgi:hypothetical protein